MKEKEANQSRYQGRIVAFRGHLTRLSELADESGLRVRAFDDVALPIFSQLDAQEQIDVLERIAVYEGVMSESLREDRHIVRNVNTLWRMLGRLRWKACDDLYRELRDDFVLELYDLKGIQLFRSFNFFGLCTYTLEEIYSKPWFELYEREDVRAEATIESVKDVLTFPERKTRPMAGGEHDVRERKRPIRRCTRIRPEVISPVFDLKGSVVGFVHTFTPLSSTDERVED